MASLFKSIATVGSNTLASRVLGFVRDLVLARVFGADAGTDAFFVAFKIPNFLRRLFAEGAFSMAFVPVLNEYRQQRPCVELKLFIDDVAGTLGAVLLLVSLIGVVGAPILVMIFAPGFIGDDGKHELAAEMLRLTFPYLFFISLNAVNLLFSGVGRCGANTFRGYTDSPGVSGKFPCSNDSGINPFDADFACIRDKYGFPEKTKRKQTGHT